MKACPCFPYKLPFLTCALTILQVGKNAKTRDIVACFCIPALLRFTTFPAFLRRLLLQELPLVLLAFLLALLLQDLRLE